MQICVELEIYCTLVPSGVHLYMNTFNDNGNKIHSVPLSFTAPATLNGDVISKAQFEALQHAMKQLEVKPQNYTPVFMIVSSYHNQKQHIEFVNDRCYCHESKS